MPLYEYECKDCGVFEMIQKFSDTPLQYCPKCEEQGKKNRVEKLISRSSFKLVGSGWYASDYKSGGSSSSSPSPSATSKASEESKSETKTEDKGAKSTSSTKCGGNCSCH